MKEFMVIAFILSAPATSIAGTEGDAYSAIEQASYKQSGVENMVNNYVEKQLKHVPKEVQKIVGNSYLIGKIITERRAAYTWSF